jgi:hypothetical protein
VSRQAQFCRSHTFTVLSHDAETTRRPSGVTAHAGTPLVWPRSVASARPVASSQTLSVWSQDAETHVPAVRRHRTRRHRAGMAYEDGEGAPGRQLPNRERLVIGRREALPQNPSRDRLLRQRGLLRQSLLSASSSWPTLRVDVHAQADAERVVSMGPTHGLGGGGSASNGPNRSLNLVG